MAKIMDTCNFYPRWNIVKEVVPELQKLRKEEPFSPLAITELQGGWFSQFGGKLSVHQEGVNAGQPAPLLDRGGASAGHQPRPPFPHPLRPDTSGRCAWGPTRSSPPSAHTWNFSGRSVPQTRRTAQECHLEESRSPPACHPEESRSDRDDEGSPQFAGNIRRPAAQRNCRDSSAPKKRGPQNDRGGKSAPLDISKEP